MDDFFVASIEAPEGGTVAAIVVGERVHVVPGAPTVTDLLRDWDRAIDELAASDPVGGRPLDEVRLLAPVPAPPNLYMVGANYADHAREMHGLGPDDDVPKSPAGPFIFLKPTTTIVGPGDDIVLATGSEKVDWEAELAAVIGRRAENVSVDEALDHVAGYTVANDVSVRDRFRRPEGTEPAMAFDWFSQKGWATSCPLGPWLLPARRRRDPAGLPIRLLRNGDVEQESDTAEMIFTVAEQIAYISSRVPLVPGDVICTGTPAGVGMGKGSFLAAGDEVVVEVEGIGRLVNRVVAG